MKTRYNSIDYLRCVLIMMVIIVHIANFGNLYPYVKDRINFFFMPAFLILTGYLVNVNKSAKDFTIYLLRIILPYTIMVLGYSVLSIYLPVRDGLSDLSLPTLLRTLCITSIGPYWFLHVMVVCGTLYYLSARVGRRFGKAAMLCVFASLLIVVAYFTPLLAVRYAAFYFMGAALRTACPQFFAAVFQPSLWATLPFAIIMLCPDYQAWGILSVAALSVSFIVFVPAIFELHGVNGKVKEALGYIGRNTFPIYIFHPIFTMAAKFLLPLFSFDATGLLHTLVCVALGLAGSLLIALFLDKTRLSYCFGKKKLLR